MTLYVPTLGISPIRALRDGARIPPIAGGAMTAAAVREESGKARTPARQVVPFVVGSHEVVEGPFVDITRQIDANGAAQGPFDVPARGFLRSVWLLVEGSGGVLGAGVLHEDYPWSILDGITLTDPNGTPYFGPMPGYSAYIANLLGGYAFESDPAADPDFVGTINCSFALRIPVEITAHDAYGALLNQDAAAPFRVSWRQTPTAANFTTAPTTTPTIRVRAWAELWEDPPEVDRHGNPIAQQPPGFPTTQYWSEQIVSVPSTGDRIIRLTRVGNPIRVLAFIYRDSTPVRSTAGFADPVRLSWDARDIYNVSRRYLRTRAYERYGRNLPTGVFVFDFIADGEGHAGNEGRKLYLPTTDATRLELAGNFTAAGTLRVLTNDVAPAGFPVAAS